MRLPRVRFTIRSLMIAVVIVAGLLVVPEPWRMLVLGVSCVGVPLSGAQWLLFRRQRRLAAFCFWVLAILINVLYAVACVYPDSYGLIFLGIGWVFIITPLFLGI